MLQIKEIVNSVFTSKSYFLYKVGDNRAWIVDIGDIDPVVSFCEENSLTLKGVFLTHGHFDHIYGLISLLQRFPECSVYTTEFGKRSLASDKLNMARYHETPITYDGDNVIVVREGESLCLFEEEPNIQFYETPGHNPGCLTMIVGDLVFTGDSYIPGLGVNTQLPHADKTEASRSLDRIMKLSRGKIVLPGHILPNANNDNSFF